MKTVLALVAIAAFAWPGAAQIDPSISLRVRPVQAPDLMDSYRKATEIRRTQQEAELVRQQTETLRKQNDNASKGGALPVSPSNMPTSLVLDSPSGVVTLPSASQILTGGIMNCRWWAVVTLDLKTPYYLGYMDGNLRALAMGVSAASDGSEQGRKLFHRLVDYSTPPNGVTGREVMKGVDAVCAVPENLPLPIPDAIAITLMRFKGSEPAEVEKEIARLRRQAIASLAK